MRLSRVNIRSKENHQTGTGGAHFHVFISDTDGSELIERTTAEQHALMKGVNGASHNPTKAGYTWSYTFGRNEYDTPDGELAEGEYAVDGDFAECRFPGTDRKEIFQIPQTAMVADVVPRAEVDKINAEFGKNIAWRAGDVTVRR